MLIVNDSKKGESKMTKKIFKNKFVIAVAILLLFLLATTITKSPQTYGRSVVIGVGLDKQDGQYLFSTQILEPKINQGFADNLQVYGATGENCLEAMEKLTVDIGKIAGLGNTSVIVLSQEIAEEGISSFLDFFIRSNRLNDNPLLVVTKDSAQQLLLDISKVDASFSLNLNSLSKFNGIEPSSQFCTMEKFLNNYYGGTTATIVGQINEYQNSKEGLAIKNELSSSSTGQTPDGGGGGGGGGQNADNKSIENNGTSSLFVSDKQVATLSAEEIRGFSECIGSTRGTYTLQNVSDEFYDNATVVVSVKQKVSSVDYKFSKNGIPRVMYNFKYILKVENVIQNGNMDLLLDSSKNYLTNALVAKFKEKVKQSIASSINLAKEYNADAFGAQSGFLKFQTKKWKNYVSKLADKSKAFQNVEFFVDISVNGVF